MLKKLTHEILTRLDGWFIYTTIILNFFYVQLDWWNLPKKYLYEITLLFDIGDTISYTHTHKDKYVFVKWGDVVACHFQGCPTYGPENGSKKWKVHTSCSLYFSVVFKLHIWPHGFSKMTASFQHERLRTHLLVVNAWS